MHSCFVSPVDGYDGYISTCELLSVVEQQHITAIYNCNVCLQYNWIKILRIVVEIQLGGGARIMERTIDFSWSKDGVFCKEKMSII